jgi:sec-independent protein translocase protein TatA
MGSFSLTHWLVVILVIVLLFGRGRISDLMGDFAKGINSFKKGLNDDAAPPAPPQVTQNPQAPAAKSPVEDARG